MSSLPSIAKDLYTTLASRLNVSAQQAERLQGMSDDSLEREARSAAMIVRRFAATVSECVGDPNAADDFLRDLDLRFVTRDHNWRRIFGKLLTSNSAGNSHKHATLSHYLNYLCSRQELIERTIRNRCALNNTNDSITDIRQPVSARPGYVRLPNAVPMYVQIPYRGESTIYLGCHRFRIVDGCPLKLAEPDDRVLSLGRGRQLLGRHPSCDRVTHREYSDVSRAHMYLEWHGDSRLQITDLSSRGTFVDSDCLDHP